MNVRLVTVSRRPPWPIWAVAVVGFWFTLGGLAVLLSAHFDRPVRLCLFKRLTGAPCLTCGFTRGMLSLLHGHFARAWLYNPLVFSALAVFLAAVALRVFCRRAVRFNLTALERRIAWIVAIALVAANWFYVIRYVG